MPQQPPTANAAAFSTAEQGYVSDNLDGIVTWASGLGWDDTYTTDVSTSSGTDQPSVNNRALLRLILWMLGYPS